MSKILQGTKNQQDQYHISKYDFSSSQSSSFIIRFVGNVPQILANQKLVSSVQYIVWPGIRGSGDMGDTRKDYVGDNVRNMFTDAT